MSMYVRSMTCICMYFVNICLYLYVLIKLNKLQKNWLSVKCEYVYVCLQYDMYLYV
jgi:hypothetical protein